MILHELITLDTAGRVDIHLPDGEQIRFAGIALAEEWLDWADAVLGERDFEAVSRPNKPGPREGLTVAREA